MKTKHTFKLIITVDASRRDVAEYIRDAVRESGGAHPKESPFFGLTKCDVQVTPLVTKPRQKWRTLKAGEKIPQRAQWRTEPGEEWRDARISFGDPITSGDEKNWRFPVKNKTP